MNVLVCFVCEKPVGNNPKHCPSKATIWRAKGNYGTTVFDPTYSSRKLQAYICDDCLKARADRVYTVVPVQVEKEYNYLPGIVDED